MNHPKPRHHSPALSCMIPRIAARFLAAMLTGTALFVSAPARADYDACMTFCLDEHNFSYCHPVCGGSASDAGTAGDTGDAGGTAPAVPLFTVEKCRTVDEMDMALWMWLTGKYGVVAMATNSMNDDGNVVAFSFSPYEDGEYTDYCTGTVTFDDACRVFETEKIECSPYED